MKELRSHRLSRIVELREKQTDACRRIFAAATEKVLAAEAAMEGIHNETLGLNDEWHVMAVQGVSAAHAVHFQRATQGLLLRLNETTLALNVARENEIKARALLEEALKKQKALEKLRMKYRHREAQDAQRHEQSQLDEFAVLRAAQEVNG